MMFRAPRVDTVLASGRCRYIYLHLPVNVLRQGRVRIYTCLAFSFGQMAHSRIFAAELARFFESSPNKIYWRSDLATIFAQHRQAWKLPQAMTSATFVSWLLANTKLTLLKLSSR